MEIKHTNPDQIREELKLLLQDTIPLPQICMKSILEIRKLGQVNLHECDFSILLWTTGKSDWLIPCIAKQTFKFSTFWLWDLPVSLHFSTVHIFFSIWSKTLSRDWATASTNIHWLLDIHPKLHLNGYWKRLSNWNLTYSAYEVGAD